MSAELSSVLARKCAWLISFSFASKLDKQHSINLSRPRLIAREISRRHRSALVVLVVAAPPGARLIAPPGCAVEPLVHAPEAVQPARVRRVGVVDDAILERERAHA